MYMQIYMNTATATDTDTATYSYRSVDIHMEIAVDTKDRYRDIYAHVIHMHFQKK